MLYSLSYASSCGSGFVINHLAKWFQEKKYNECAFMATDINYDAAHLTKRVSNFYSVSSSCRISRILIVARLESMSFILISSTD